MIKRLPDSEFEVMEVIWAHPSPLPLTTLQIMNHMKPGRTIKLQTLLTMLLRLTEKGFLTSERIGRERSYTPIVSKPAYMQVETEAFLARHNISSLSGLVETFYESRDISTDDMKELYDRLDQKR